MRSGRNQATSMTDMNTGKSFFMASPAAMVLVAFTTSLSAFLKKAQIG